MNDIESLRDVLHDQLDPLVPANAGPALLKRARRRRARSISATAVLSVAVLAGIALPLKAMWPLVDNDRPSLGSQPATPVPDVAKVICADDQTTLQTTELQPQPDGYHFQVDTRDGSRALSFSAPGSRSTSAIWGPDPAAPWEAVMVLHPGDTLVSCEKGDEAQMGVPEPGSPLIRLDPMVFAPEVHSALLDKAMALSRANGDAHPATVEAVLTTWGQFEKSPGDRTGDPQQSVYLVQATGDFVCAACRPPGSLGPTPSGPSMSFAMSTDLSPTEYFSCCGQPVHLSSLGMAVDLLAAPETAHSPSPPQPPALSPSCTPPPDAGPILEELTQVKSELADLNARIATVDPNSPRYAALAARRTNAESRIAFLKEQVAGLSGASPACAAETSPSSSPTQPPTLGASAAAEYGLPLLHHSPRYGECGYFVEVVDEGSNYGGYCLDGLGLTGEEKFLLEQRLRGREATQDQLDNYRDWESGAGGGDGPTPSGNP